MIGSRGLHWFEEGVLGICSAGIGNIRKRLCGKQDDWVLAKDENIANVVSLVNKEANSPFNEDHHWLQSYHQGIDFVYHYLQ
eukprot:scaffold50097_cov33-Attheya_sp.AAC.2